jgi:aminopeptidase-like protein
MSNPYIARVDSGEKMIGLMRDLFPICRSITGDGFRESLRRVSQIAPLAFTDVPTGMRVFDWTVPKEWNIYDAWIEDPSGRRVVDLKDSSLHAVSYSVPVRARMSLSALKAHLHSLPERPDAIPYRTSYYSETWGFCLSHRVLESLVEGDYEVCIESTLAPGNLTYGEYVLPGKTDEEILISAHSCHPALANDNLSGMAVAAHLAEHLSALPREHTFRFLFIPGTIGSITWLALNEATAKRVRHGLVLSCLGDSGHPTYKRSRRATDLVDQAAGHVLSLAGPHAITDFVPYGYDERQYCSPGFDLPVGCLTRTPNGKYPEYHTSDDNLDFVKADSLADSLNKALAIIEVLEHDRTYINLNPKCEPQLGRRGLYRNTGGTSPADFEMSLLWVLNFSDGHHSLLDIAERARIPFSTVRRAAEALLDASLLALVDWQPTHRQTRTTPSLASPTRSGPRTQRNNR